MNRDFGLSVIEKEPNLSFLWYWWLPPQGKKSYTSCWVLNTYSTRQLPVPESAYNSQHLNPAFLVFKWTIDSPIPTRLLLHLPFKKSKVQRGGISSLQHMLMASPAQHLVLNSLSLGTVKDGLLPVLSFSWSMFVDLKSLFLHRHGMTL